MKSPSTFSLAVTVAKVLEAVEEVVAMVTLSNKAKEHLLDMRKSAMLGPNQVWWLEGTPDNPWITMRDCRGKRGRILRNSAGVPILGFEKSLDQALEDRLIDLSEDGKVNRIVCRSCGS